MLDQGKYFNNRFILQNIENVKNKKNLKGSK